MDRYEHKIQDLNTETSESIQDLSDIFLSSQSFVFDLGEQVVTPTAETKVFVADVAADNSLFSSSPGLSGVDIFGSGAQASESFAREAKSTAGDPIKTLLSVDAGQPAVPPVIADGADILPLRRVADVGPLRVDSGYEFFVQSTPELSAQPSQEGVTEPSQDSDSFVFAGSSVALVSVNSAPKPVATIPQLADYLINGFWQYNSDIAHHWGASTISYNIDALTTAEKFLAQSALNAWHEVANINFVQTSGTANITYNHNGTMTAYETDTYNGSGFMSYATIDISADWITTDGGAYDGKTGIDSYGYQTYLHETGHALGLGHQGPYNGSASYSTNATYANDTWQYSIMSYFGEQNYNGGSYRYVITPQMADIYAVQSIYGAATTRAGDTVYGFNNTAGSIYNFSAYSPAPAYTVYDSGGRDTLDCSGYSSAQTIDLHPGSFSSVGGLVHNIGIATNSIIEVAIGGSGSDVLIANDAGCTLIGNAGNDALYGGTGADRLVGGPGVDSLTGGAGIDIFVFTAGTSSAASGQRDFVTDFTVGQDKIDVSAFDAIPSTAGVIDLFSFLLTTAFNGVAGVLNYFFDGARNVTVVQGDTNGDRAADFAIDLAGNVALTPDDFIGITFASTPIESNGLTSLNSLGSHFYLVGSSGFSPSLKYGGADFVSGQSGPWAPIGAESTTSGYQVAWKVTGADQYTVWNTNGNGEFVSDTIGVVSGTSIAWESIEPSFHQDLNGDGVIGLNLPTIVVETAGSTNLTSVGSQYYLYNGSGSGPSLKYGGVNFVSGQSGSWTPIGAEVTTSGYQVAWKVAGADQYTIWNTDSSGNFTSDTIGVVSGSSIAWQSIEPSFHQDLNGDGVIGLNLPTTVIETSGSTNLTSIGNHFYLYNGSGSGPSLKYGGADFVSGQSGPWTPIGAEVTASGYQVAWKVTGADQYTVWNTDSSGNFTSDTIGVVSGSSVAWESIETSFHQDLNGDGVIGLNLPTTAIETAGSTSLTSVGNHFYLYNSFGLGPSLKYGGADFVSGQSGPWTPIGAEVTASGYQVAWKVTGADQYTVWNTDSSGNFTSDTIGVVSGNSNAWKSIEPSFHQDLNGDGVIGVATVTAAAFVNDAATDIFDFKASAAISVAADQYLIEGSVQHDYAELQTLVSTVNNIIPEVTTLTSSDMVEPDHAKYAGQPILSHISDFQIF